MRLVFKVVCSLSEFSCRSHITNSNCCQVDARTTSCWLILLTFLLLTNIVDTIFDEYFKNSNCCQVDAENDKLLTDITFILTMRRKTLFYTVSLIVSMQSQKSVYYLSVMFISLIKTCLESLFSTQWVYIVQLEKPSNVYHLDYFLFHPP